jgi:hypothetical protein
MLKLLSTFNFICLAKLWSRLKKRIRASLKGAVRSKYRSSVIVLRGARVHLRPLRGARVHLRIFRGARVRLCSHQDAPARRAQAQLSARAWVLTHVCSKSEKKSEKLVAKK